MNKKDKTAPEAHSLISSIDTHNKPPAPVHNAARPRVDGIPETPPGTISSEALDAARAVLAKATRTLAEKKPRPKPRLVDPGRTSGSENSR